MNPTRRPEPLISEAEAAEMLGITKDALGRLRRADRAPVHTRVGRFPRYSRRHILEYLERNARGATRGR